ncbi:MAG: hypothetical protein HY553_11725 [Elusimicrobia bacterium]|nr:hypothetical protein [Elusimicrobiota bacterium]
MMRTAWIVGVGWLMACTWQAPESAHAGVLQELRRAFGKGEDSAVPAIGPTRSSSQPQERIGLRANFNACVALHDDDYAVSTAADVCRRLAREFSFVKNPNFDRCMALHKSDFTTVTAVDTCMKLAPRFSFVDNPNFDRCLSIYTADFTKTTSVAVCMDRMWFRFIGNHDFDRCMSLYSRDYTKSTSADECMRGGPFP